MKKLTSWIAICCSVWLVAAIPDENGYVMDWLISGPYPSYVKDGQPDGLDSDLLEGGELNATPYPGLAATAVFKADKGQLIAGIGSTNEWGFKENVTLKTDWTVRHFEKPIMALDNLAKPIEDYYVMYAAVWLEAPNDVDAKFRMGSDDDHKVWLNGVLVGRASGSQAVMKDNFIYKVGLHQGLNYVLVKIVDRTQDCGFCFAVSDMDDKPLPGLVVHSVHPGRALGAELYNNGYGGRFELPGERQFAGKITGIFRFAMDEAARRLHEGKPVRLSLAGKVMEVRHEGAYPFEVEMAEGTGKLSATVLDGDKPVAVLQQPITVYSQEKLEAENLAMQAKIEKLQAEIPLLQRDLQTAKAEQSAVRSAWLASFSERERRYTVMHETAIDRAPQSLDEPLAAVQTPRSSLCLNGDWELSGDHERWISSIQPCGIMNDYHRRTYYPVKLKEPQNIYGPVVPLPGWEDFDVGNIVIASPMWLRRKVNLRSDVPAEFVCENIVGTAVVSLNGKVCGEYHGFIGVVRIPLRGVLDGENLLEVKVERLNVGQFGPNRPWGLQGAIFVETAHPVRVADAWVKTSWRRSVVSVKTELENRSDTACQAVVRQAVVEHGRVRLRLLEKRLEVGAGAVVVVDNASRWADPKCWGIGGKYGDPDLYELVTDVVVDGKVVDRHVQPFGFREFWIHGTDFYLNGKRIVLQGDTGSCPVNIPKMVEVVWPLYRADGINLVRVHDNAAWEPHAATMADRMGMLYYAQMYPTLHEGKADSRNYVPYDEWFKTSTHQFNLKEYAAWHRMLRNHPSVVIWSTDNEILTQSWDTADKAAYNVRNDRIAAFYEQFTKSLDPDIVMTRDGDVGTWGHRGRWHETPPCDTANYHYPDFNINTQVVDWQNVYDYRPAVFGETLYYSYGAWDNWIGPIPSQVEKKAKRVSQVAALYRELEIPCVVYMGLGHDGFCGWDDTGKGSPWGITRTMTAAWDKDNSLPPGLRADQYPYYRLEWPAHSGRGSKPMFRNIHPKHGGGSLNWFDSTRPSHVRNAVNDAYRAQLLPQPALRQGSDAECIVRTTPNTPVWVTDAAGVRQGVLSDALGRAWIQVSRPGDYVFEIDGIKRKVTLESREGYASRPGFGQIRVVEW